jgi:hypothetical protein
VATRDVFSEEEQAQLRGFPEINRAELVRHFTLTGADVAFLRRFRTGRNVLGVAVQLCTLPWLGFVPDDVPAAPAVAVGWLSQRLGVAVAELRGYGTDLNGTGQPLGYLQTRRPSTAYRAGPVTSGSQIPPQDSGHLTAGHTVAAGSGVDLVAESIDSFTRSSSGRQHHGTPDSGRHKTCRECGVSDK